MDYAPHTDAQVQEMLRAIGVTSWEELVRAVPEDLRKPMEVPAGLTEPEVLAVAERLADANTSLQQTASFLGGGCYAHTVPTAVDAIASRGEWLTPYTPYQAEASQGILQAIYEFQTMICQLTGMDVANASVYDGASAVAEAAVLAMHATERPRLLVSEAVHPHAREVLATYVSGSHAIVQQVPTVNGVTDLEALKQSLGPDVALVLLQQPNVFGCLEPMAQAAGLAHQAGSLFAASVYPVSLGLLQPPGAYGADIAVGEARCLGTPPSFGGPGLGIFATTQALVRRMPGRLAGCTVDASGRRGFTLTLQTREQHIRRERATSNICTNEGWIMLRATLFLSLLGPDGLREMAQRNLDLAHYARQRLTEVPWVRAGFDQPFFNEFVLQYDGRDPARVNKALARAGITGGLPLREWYPTMPEAALWCATELTSRESIDRAAETLKTL